MNKTIINWLLKLLIIILMIILNDHIIIPIISTIEWKVAISFVMGAITIALVSLTDKLFED